MASVNEELQSTNEELALMLPAGVIGQYHSDPERVSKTGKRGPELH